MAALREPVTNCEIFVKPDLERLLKMHSRHLNARLGVDVDHLTSTLMNLDVNPV